MASTLAENSEKLSEHSGHSIHSLTLEKIVNSNLDECDDGSVGKNPEPEPDDDPEPEPMKVELCDQPSPSQMDSDRKTDTKSEKNVASGKSASPAVRKSKFGRRIKPVDRMDSFSMDSNDEEKKVMPKNPDNMIQQQPPNNLVSVDSIPEGLKLSGQLVWAKLKGYPFWPAILVPDPQGDTDRHWKGVAKTSRILLHVKFVDDGRFAWVNQSDLVPYEGQEKFELYAKEQLAKLETSKNATKSDKERITSRFGIGASRKRNEKALSGAIQIADQLAKIADLQMRIKTTNALHESTKKKPKPVKISEKSPAVKPTVKKAVIARRIAPKVENSSVPSHLEHPPMFIKSAAYVEQQLQRIIARSSKKPANLDGSTSQKVSPQLPISGLSANSNFGAKIGSKLVLKRPFQSCGAYVSPNGKGESSGYGSYGNLGKRVKLSGPGSGKATQNSQPKFHANLLRDKLNKTSVKTSFAGNKDSSQGISEKNFLQTRSVNSGQAGGQKDFGTHRHSLGAKPPVRIAPRPRNSGPDNIASLLQVAAKLMSPDQPSTSKSVVTANFLDTSYKSDSSPQSVDEKRDKLMGCIDKIMQRKSVSKVDNVTAQESCSSTRPEVAQKSNQKSNVDKSKKVQKQRKIQSVNVDKSSSVNEMSKSEDPELSADGDSDVVVDCLPDTSACYFCYQSIQNVDQDDFESPQIKPILCSGGCSRTFHEDCVKEKCDFQSEKMARFVCDRCKMGQCQFGGLK